MSSSRPSRPSASRTSRSPRTSSLRSASSSPTPATIASATPAAGATPEPRRTLSRLGRPPKLSRPFIATIATHVRNGAPLEIAALAAGVPRRVFPAWLRLAHDLRRRLAQDPAALASLTPDERLHLELLDATDQSAAEAQLDDLLAIARAATKSWQAAAWLLERLFPEQYARRSAAAPDLTEGTGTGAVITTSVSLSDEEQHAIARRHYQRLQEDEANRAHDFALAALAADPASAALDAPTGSPAASGPA